MQRTVELWNEHGLVMRTAIDLSLTVPEIGELWDHTADLFITAITAVLERAGIQAGTEPHQSSAMARALCWMIERTFYHASQESREKLEEASATCEHIWLTSAGLSGVFEPGPPRIGMTAGCLGRKTRAMHDRIMARSGLQTQPSPSLWSTVMTRCPDMFQLAR